MIIFWIHTVSLISQIVVQTLIFGVRLVSAVWINRWFVIMSSTVWTDQMNGNAVSTGF